MSATLFLPGLFTVLLVVGVGAVRSRLHPRAALLLLTTGALTAASLTLMATATTAAVFLLGPTRAARLIELCRIIPVHHRVSTFVGFAAMAALSIMGIRLAMAVLLRRRILRSAPNQRITIVDTDEPLAYAIPSASGCVVVSTGMLRGLDPRERQVVFAHERAHLRQRHHRYLFAVGLAVAILPPLRPLLAQVRHTTERCADEEAVAALDGDRGLVATTVARAALHRATYGGAAILGFGGGSIGARVRALSQDVSPSTPFPVAATAAAISLVAVAGVSLQLHHLYGTIGHICNG